MATKYIFVSGGVVSGIGKGITAAALGCLLKARGLTVRNQKFDPYINVDPGLMSPTQHGEVFITDDGAETDLDVGHYERFTDENLTIESDITSGMIYRDVINRERTGGYHGNTVQVVPHIIQEIKHHLLQLAQDASPDVVITEIGGTVGDMEGQPYLEAIRQIGYEAGRGNVLFIHVTLIPYLRKAGEIKTKPTQHSVRKLLSMGIQPDILVCRSEVAIDSAVREKLALFCNVEPACVIQNLDVDTVYRLPLLLETEGLAKAVCRKLNLASPAPILSDWQHLVAAHEAADQPLTVTLVGKYVSLHDAYLSVIEALRHASIRHGTRPELRWVSSEDLERDGWEEQLDGSDAIIIPGGFGPRGMAGMIRAAGYARVNAIPCLAIGLGMQMAAVEYARSVAGWPEAHSAEAETGGDLFVLPVDGNESGQAAVDQPMRRGALPCTLAPGSRLAAVYGLEQISERFHHRWVFNSSYRAGLAVAGLAFSAATADQQPAAFELTGHPWFIGVLYHPEFKSRPTRPHPLFADFIRTALNRASCKDPAQ